MDLRNVTPEHAGLLVGLGTMCHSKAGLAEGTNAATIKTAAPNGAGVDYSIDGVMYHKADTDNIAVTAAAEQAANTTCFYLFSINAAGTVRTTKGTVGRLAWPECPAGECPIGGMKVVTTAAFTAGTTDLSAAGITATFFDFSGIPFADPT